MAPLTFSSISSPSSLAISVPMKPGQTALTVTPRPANSLALDMVKPQTPPLADA